MRRNAPLLIVAVGLLTLLAAFVWYSQNVLSNLRSEAKQTAAMYAKVYGAINDTSSAPGAETATLVDMVESLTSLRVPVILTDAKGAGVGHANLPFESEVHDILDSPHIRAYADT